MSFYLYLLAGLVSGVLGGMGMGGGTVLIPVLTLFFGVEQHAAQAANLIAFLPMAAISLNMHQKSGLLQTEGTGYIIIPAVLLSALGGVAASLISAQALKKLFGAFLVFLAVKGIMSFKVKR